VEDEPMSGEGNGSGAGRDRGEALMKWLRRGACLALAAVGLLIVAKLGRQLAHELSMLMAEWQQARDSYAVGYIGIYGEMPEPRPDNCIRRENGRLYLWAGTGVPGQAVWYDVTGIKYPIKQFRFAFGRDKIKTIDYPIYEDAQGQISRRIPPERPVLGVEFDGVVRAYPVRIMRKVEVVNDMFGDRPVAVTYSALSGRPAVYERSVAGEPISFGSSGYCYKKMFILYDRRTDSLWYPTKEGLTAISGPRAGTVLKRIYVPQQMSWDQWRALHPDTMVLVGADRERGIPFDPKHYIGGSRAKQAHAAAD